MNKNVRAKVELKIPYDEIPEPRDKKQKFRSSGKKSNGKVLKSFVLETMTEEELLQRTEAAVSMLKDGKMDKANIQKIAEKFTKPLEIKHASLLKEMNEKLEKMANSNVELLEKVKELEGANEAIVKENEVLTSQVTSQPVKPTKPKKKAASPTVASASDEDSQPIKPTKK